LPGAARKENWKDLGKGRLRAGKGIGEEALHLLVEVGDDREQIGTGFREVLQLLGEKLVPLLERRKLLERERIDATELGETFLCASETLLLLFSRKRRGVV